MQPVESVLGGMDGAVLERLAKIMGYMRVAPGAKPGKRLKKRDKQRMLEGGVVPSGAGSAAANGAGPTAHSGRDLAANGAAEPGAMPPPPPKPAAADDEVSVCMCRCGIGLLTCTVCLPRSTWIGEWERD